MALGTVLVVGDDPLLLDLLGDALAPRGYRVVASDTIGCLVAARRERPGLILLDVWPHRAAAAQAVSGLRAGADTAHIPVVALAAPPLGPGPIADAWLLKPFHLAELYAAVARWLPPDGVQY